MIHNACLEAFGGKINLRTGVIGLGSKQTSLYHKIQNLSPAHITKTRQVHYGVTSQSYETERIIRFENLKWEEAIPLLLGAIKLIELHAS